MEDVEINEQIDKLKRRIRNTAGVRFTASRRIKFNYTLANLTVVVLSLWAIFISYILSVDIAERFGFDVDLLETAGIVLPVFIVVFSLIEGGETYLRAHLLELNARQLRELGDKLAGEYAKIPSDQEARATFFQDFSHRYNDILERSPVNHDEVDHWSSHYKVCREKETEFSAKWWYYSFWMFLAWIRRQLLRAVYLFLWALPVGLYLAS